MPPGRRPVLCPHPPPVSAVAKPPATPPALLVPPPPPAGRCRPSPVACHRHAQLPGHGKRSTATVAVRHGPSGTDGTPQPTRCGKSRQWPIGARDSARRRHGRRSATPPGAPPRPSHAPTRTGRQQPPAGAGHPAPGPVTGGQRWVLARQTSPSRACAGTPSGPCGRLWLTQVLHDRSWCWLAAKRRRRGRCGCTPAARGPKLFWLLSVVWWLCL